MEPSALERYHTVVPHNGQIVLKDSKTEQIQRTSDSSCDVEVSFQTPLVWEAKNKTIFE